MDILETVIKTKRVASLQVRFASVSDELSYHWVLIFCTCHKKYIEAFQVFDYIYTPIKYKLLDAFPQTYHQCGHDMLK